MTTSLVGIYAVLLIQFAILVVLIARVEKRLETLERHFPSDGRDLHIRDEMTPLWPTHTSVFAPFGPPVPGAVAKVVEEEP